MTSLGRFVIGLLGAGINLDFSISAIRRFRSLTGFERKGDFAADNGSVVLGGDLEHGSAAAATLCSGSVDVASPI